MWEVAYNKKCQHNKITQVGEGEIKLDGHTVLDWRQDRGRAGNESGLNGALNGV